MQPTPKQRAREIFEYQLDYARKRVTKFARGLADRAGNKGTADPFYFMEWHGHSALEAAAQVEFYEKVSRISDEAATLEAALAELAKVSLRQVQDHLVTSPSAEVDAARKVKAWVYCEGSDTMRSAQQYLEAVFAAE